MDAISASKISEENCLREVFISIKNRANNGKTEATFTSLTNEQILQLKGLGYRISYYSNDDWQGYVVYWKDGGIKRPSDFFNRLITSEKYV